MSDHDLGFGQQRSKLRRIALIVEDRGFERRLTSARIRGATVAAKCPRNRAFICSPYQLTMNAGLRRFS
jgi:hypothetical protein